MTQSAYHDCLASMFKLQRFGIKLGLDIIGRMLEALGNPQNNFNAIHIAGTNGKGSVAAMLSAIFDEAGLSVGCFTSPHLERFNERIAVNKIPIEDQAVIQAYQRVKAIKGLSRSATFFEFATAMAFNEFSRRGVQWAIVETGMGGRLDATNILQPVLSIITNISMEHQTYLGSTLHAIAGEKAGIIKNGIPVVTGVRQAAAIKAIETKARGENAPLYRYGQAFRSRKSSTPSCFSYRGIKHDWPHLELSLTGDHQVQNAALVLAACEILNQSGHIALSEDIIRRGLAHTQWPGRLEVVSTEPVIILDGAHNQMSARILGRHLATHYKERNIILVVGILDDKPYRSILKDLTAPCAKVIITQPQINRALAAEKLAAIVNEMGIQGQAIPRVADAVKHAIAICEPDDIICIAGSLYVVGEARTALADLGLVKTPDAASK